MASMNLWPTWTCPACGKREIVSEKGSGLVNRYAYFLAHKHRCAIAEGYLPDDAFIESAWAALGVQKGKPPEIHYQVRGVGGCGTASFAGTQRRLRRIVHVSLRESPACVLGTVLHEMCHHAHEAAALGDDTHGYLEDHTPAFNARLLTAAHRLWSDAPVALTFAQKPYDHAGNGVRYPEHFYKDGIVTVWARHNGYEDTWRLDRWLCTQQMAGTGPFAQAKRRAA